MNYLKKEILFYILGVLRKIFNRESSRKLYKFKSGDKAKKKQKGANTFVLCAELVTTSPSND